MSLASTRTRAHREHRFTDEVGCSFRLCVFDSPVAPPLSGTSETPSPDSFGVPVLLCVHGAGMSSECFFRLISALQELPHEESSAASPLGSVPVPASLPHNMTGPHPRPGIASSLSPPATPGGVEEVLPLAVVTYDLRCHGASTFEGGEANLTLSALVRDFHAILQHVIHDLFPHSCVYVFGHSLGGSIITHGLASADAALTGSVGGAILVDVVEKTATLSLHHMKDFLRKRPTSFQSLQDAEVWFLQHGGMNSPDGAAVSVPPLLQQDTATGLWVWRTNLNAMESVWDGWFVGLDSAFVSLRMPKMLCLANTERLDKDLTIAQMQGKFQLEIIGNNCGHYLMDDATSVVAGKVMRFVKRIEILTRKVKACNKPGAPMILMNTTASPSRTEQ